MRYATIPIPDDACLVSEASRRLDVSVTQIHRLLEDSTLERRDVEGCPILVTLESIQVYEKKRERAGDRRLMTLVTESRMTPEEAATFIQRPIEQIYTLVNSRELTQYFTSHGFLVLDRTEVSHIKLRY
jgi:hypothetical protein